MMLSSSTHQGSSTTPCNASAEALLEVIFDTRSLSPTVVQDGGMRVSVVVPSRGTVVDAVWFRQGDPIDNLTACLSRSTCYGVEIINAWKGSYRVIYDGEPLTNNALQFPYYVTAEDKDASPSSWTGSNRSTAVAMTATSATTDDVDGSTTSFFEPYESNLTFVELISSPGSGSSACVPQCQSDNNETLNEVVIYAGNDGDGTMGWRIQDDDGQILMGCQDDDSGGGSNATAKNSSAQQRCGTVNGVRVSRACLPTTQGCRQFVMGHPQQVPSEGSGAVDDSSQHELDDTGANSSEDGNGEYEADNRWVGHYPPSYRVAVHGNDVAEGLSATFASAEINGGGEGEGGDCSCPLNETLLEVFQYRTGPLQYTLRDVQTDQLLLTTPPPTSGNSTLHNEGLWYDRRCVPSSQCYDLVVDRGANSGDNNDNTSTSDDAGVSTQIVLGGTYYANTAVRDLPFKLLLGELCGHRDACAPSEALLRVEISTSGTPLNDTQHVPGYYCAWSVFDANHPPESHLPEESTTYFSNGYPGGGRYLHFQCVPSPSINATSSDARLSFGMLNSVSQDDVTWSLERNGVILGCREDRRDAARGTVAPHPYLSDYILTPLDGSCLSSIGSPPSSSPTTSTNAVVGIVVGIVASVVLLAVAVFYVGAGDDEAETMTTTFGAATGGRSRRTSSRSTGTVGDNESDCSDEDECVP